jgi:hypothetical protein
MPALICSARLRLILFLLCQTAFLLGAVSVHGQSTDPTFPTPVGSKEIFGAIPARDIGDARLTDQFYGFTGAPGDLFITIQSRNLNGDFDIFTAGELRPLLKITVYAESTTPVTKNIYLRRRESLILRVEGRTPNDDDATYQIRFSGSFEPISGGVMLAESDRQPAESEKQPSKTGNRRGTRVSSVGARIEEPPTEVAATPTPEPPPMATPGAVPEKPEPAESARKTSSRNPRARGGTARKSPSKPSPATASKSGEAQDTSTAATEAEKAEKSRPEESAKPATTNKSSTEDKNKPETAKSDTKPATDRRTTSRRNSPSARDKAGAPDQTGARLVIERKDGSRVEYPMNTITRVTIENGQIMILKNDGYLIKVPMANVARMSIGP